MEVQRIGHGLVAEFPAASTQVSAVFNYPATIKAFHYHLEHTDCWTPTGVAHGYKVIGSQGAWLVYLTDRFYDPRDEGRIAYNDPGINYDWETQRK